MNKKDKKEIQFEQPSDILLMANRYIMFIISFIILAILVLGYFFVLKPKIDSINVIEDRFIQTEDRRAANEEFLSKLDELEAEYQDILNNRREDLEYLKKIVPEGSQTAELFVIADRLAKKHGFQLLEIGISDSLDKKSNKTNPEDNTQEINNLLLESGIKSTKIRLDVFKVIEGESSAGTDVYSDFKDYLAELENSIRLLDVQTISFESIDSEVTADVAEGHVFSLDLITYYR